jgi:hypothetical protein
VHEVALDPNPGRKLAYVSYYAGGFRVLEYGTGGLKEVGAFIDEGGNNFWGVEVHKIAGQQYVLASDRDFGLYHLPTSELVLARWGRSMVSAPTSRFLSFRAPPPVARRRFCLGPRGRAEARS